MKSYPAGLDQRGKEWLSKENRLARRQKSGYTVACYEAGSS